MERLKSGSKRTERRVVTKENEVCENLIEGVSYECVNTGLWGWGGLKGVRLHWSLRPGQSRVSPSRSETRAVENTKLFDSDNFSQSLITFLSIFSS